MLSKKCVHMLLLKLLFKKLHIFKMARQISAEFYMLTGLMKTANLVKDNLKISFLLIEIWSFKDSWGSLKSMIYWSPNLSGRTFFLNSSVCPFFILSVQRILGQPSISFFEILPQVAPQYIVVYLRFSIFQKFSIQPIFAIFQCFLLTYRKTLH